MFGSVDAGLDLFVGLVVLPAESAVDTGEVGFGFGQGALSGLGHGAGFFGGPDVGDPEAAFGTGFGVGDGEVAQSASVAGALVGWQVLFAAGDVLHRSQGLVAGVGAEPVEEAGAGTQRDDEPQAGPVGLAEVLDVSERGVGHDEQPGREQRGQVVHGLAQAGQLGGVAGVRAHIQRHAGVVAGGQHPDLALDLAGGVPAPADQVGGMNIRRKALRYWAAVRAPNVGLVDTGTRKPAESTYKLRGFSPSST